MLCGTLEWKSWFCWPLCQRWLHQRLSLTTSGAFHEVKVVILIKFSISVNTDLLPSLLYVEHISCVITNCGQHQWAIPSLFSIALEALLEENIARKLLLLSLDLFLKILLFQPTFLIFFSIAVFSPYFLLVGLLLQYVALYQSRELVKV